MLNLGRVLLLLAFAAPFVRTQTWNQITTLPAGTQGVYLASDGYVYASSITGFLPRIRRILQGVSDILRMD